MVSSATQGPGDARPANPDPTILKIASRELAQRVTGGVPATWEVLNRQDRPRSTLFRLRTYRQGEAIHAFYKADYLPDNLTSVSRENRARQHRQAIVIEKQLTSPLREAFAADGIRFDEALAADPDALVVVRLAVPGRILGKTIKYSLPGRRKAAMQMYRSVGKALRLIEKVGRLPMPDLFADAESKILRDLERTRPLLPAPQHRMLERLIGEFVNAIDVDDAVSWTHGDVSQTNILRQGHTIGFIDFSWLRGLRGFAPAQLIYRVETETPALSQWTSAATTAILDGYGIDQSDPTPEWRLAHLQRALRAIRKKPDSAHLWGRQAIEHLLFD